MGCGGRSAAQGCQGGDGVSPPLGRRADATGDRKSTRLNSSHTVISYAVFCLKKKKNSAKTCSGSPPPGETKTSILRPAHTWIGSTPRAHTHPKLTTRIHIPRFDGSLCHNSVL